MPNLNTPLGMHLEVLQGLQKVDSFRQDMFYPEEIDLQLNKQQDRFIEQLVNREFQGPQIRMDYVKNLLVKNYRLTPLKLPDLGIELIVEPKYEPLVVYNTLPPDYLHLVSDRSGLSELVTCAEIEDDDIPTSTYTEYITTLEFPESGETLDSYYIDFKIEVPGPLTVYENNNFDISGPPASPPHVGVIKSPEDRENLINDVLEKFYDAAIPNTRIYWETYRGVTYPSSFIIVATTAQTYTLSYLMPDASTDRSVPSVLQTTLTLDSVVIDDAALYNNLGIEENKLSEGDKLYKFSKNVFYKPTKKEPHSTLSGGYLFVYHNKSYIITDLYIDYIRKPRQISLALNQTCELSGTAPRLIVDATVEYLKLVIENPAYQGILQDNQLRNQNLTT